MDPKNLRYATTHEWAILDGDICTLGLFCAAVPGTNRNLLDFIDIAVDHGGFFHAAYTDDHNYPGGALVMANQVAGPTVGPGGH